MLFILIVHNVKINSKLIITMGERNVVPHKLENTFNKMLLFTSNLFPEGFVPSLPAIAAKATDVDSITSIRTYIDGIVVVERQQNHIRDLMNAYKQRLMSSTHFYSAVDSKQKCIAFDLISLNGTPSVVEDNDIQDIATRFYKIALEVHLYSLLCIKESEGRQMQDVAAGLLTNIPFKEGVLFENPLFNAYDGTFQGADGIHDLVPRGDLAGLIFSAIKKEGGWTIIKLLVGPDSQERLTNAVRASSLRPTDNQTDDTAKVVVWDSLNKDSGHRLLEAMTSADRLVCNVVLPELEILPSVKSINSGNRFKVVQVQGSLEGPEIATPKARSIYGLAALNNNYAVSDCAGPTPSQLQDIIASANPVLNADEDGDEDDVVQPSTKLTKEQLKALKDAAKAKRHAEKGQKGAEKKRGKKNTTENVTSVVSGILDSSSANESSGINKLNAVTGLQDYSGFVTFLLPHTRWSMAGGKGVKDQVLHILQRVIINFKDAETKYKIRFEVWITEAKVENSSQAYPSKFLSKSEFFELKSDDKSPGVNETIRYIFSYCSGKKTAVKDLTEQYIKKMFLKPKDQKDNTTSAKETKLFFDKFLNAYNQCINGLPKVPRYTQFLDDANLLRMAFIFRQKTMGDFLRLADTAYLNEILWVYLDKWGIAVEGTCDGYSGIKAMAANNCPVILCSGSDWGYNYKIYSSLAVDAEAGEKAAILKRKKIYVEKTTKLKVNMEMLRVYYYKIKTKKIDVFLSNFYSIMRDIFQKSYKDGKNFITMQVTEKAESINSSIILWKNVLTDAIASGSRDQVRATKEIDNNRYAISLLENFVENTFSILGLFLLMNTFVERWLNYCDYFLKSFDENIGSFIEQIDNSQAVPITDESVKTNTETVDKCISFLPTTVEMDKIDAFLEIFNKNKPGWTQDDAMGEMTLKLLTLDMKKDVALGMRESELKKLVDKGSPNLLCQDKTATVGYTSLLNYRDVLLSLNELYSSLSEFKEQGVIITSVELPQTNIVFNSGILNQPAQQEFILWFTQEGKIAVTEPEIPVAVPVSEPEVVVAVPIPEEIKLVDEAVKKPKTSRLNKMLNVVKSVASLISLRSRSFRTRSGKIRPAGGGLQKGGAVIDFDGLLDNLLANLIEGQQNKEDKAALFEYYKNIGDNLPVLYGGLEFYRDKGESVSESSSVVADGTGIEGVTSLQLDDAIQEFLKQEQGEETFVERSVTDDYLTNDNDNNVVSSSIEEIEESLGQLVVSMDDNAESENTTSELVGEINAFNKGLVDGNIDSINTFLSSDEFSKYGTSIGFLKEFLQVYDDAAAAASAGHLGVAAASASDDDVHDDDYYSDESISKDGIYSLCSVLLKFFSDEGVTLDDGSSLRIRYSLDSFLLYDNNGKVENIVRPSLQQGQIKSVDGQLFFKEAIKIKLSLVFVTLIASSDLFREIMDTVVPNLFFKYSKEYGDNILRKDVIYFVISENYGVKITEEQFFQYKNLYEVLAVAALVYNDDLLRSAVSEFYFKTNGTAIQLLPDMGTEADVQALNKAPETTLYIKRFYAEYYNGITPTDFPIPVEKTTLPFLFLHNVDQGERTPLVTMANKSIPDQFAAKCEELVLRPLLDYFLEFYCSGELKMKLINSVKYNLLIQRKTLNEDNATRIKKMLTSYLYCYLFGTCENAVKHNGVIMDDVPGEIISLRLVQYTTTDRTYLSYSVAELQSIVKQFMEQPSYKELVRPVITARQALDNFLNEQEQRMYQNVGGDIDVETPEVDQREEELRRQLEVAINGEKKTPQQWNEWAKGIPDNQVKLQQRPETSEQLMNMFMGDILDGVVKNYKYFNKKQREELGINNLTSPSFNVLRGDKPKNKTEQDAYNYLLGEAKKEIEIKLINQEAKPRTLMELYNIVLYNVALVNIENVNVAKVSLLSKRIGNYLSNMEDLMNDILSGIDLDNPMYTFTNLIISLFATMTQERIDNALSKKERLLEFINETIDQYNKDSEFRRQLRMIISEYSGLESNINGIVKNAQVKTTIFGTLFSSRSTSPSEQEKYRDFLTGLVPKKRVPLNP